MYDKIYIGTSIPMLFYIYFHLNKNENILILNKETYYGGSWYTKSNKYCNDFDTAGHFIVIRNKKNMDKVLLLFKSIDVEICHQNAEIHNDNYKFIYDSLIFYPKDGWDKLINTLINKINSEIRLNTKVLEIYINNNVMIKIKQDNIIKNIETKKIILPSYVKLNNIIVNNKIFNLDYKLCTTYHIIFYCKIKNNYKYNNSFHGFYEGDLLFDRLTCVCNPDKMKDFNNVNQLLILRVSRAFKDKFLKMDNHEITNNFFKFINKKNINFKNLKIKDLEIFDYKFYYRQDHIINLMNQINKFKNIELINTTDLGMLIENYFKNND